MYHILAKDTKAVVIDIQNKSKLKCIEICISQCMVKNGSWWKWTNSWYMMIYDFHIQLCTNMYIMVVVHFMYVHFKILEYKNLSKIEKENTRKLWQYCSIRTHKFYKQFYTRNNANSITDQCKQNLVGKM